MQGRRKVTDRAFLALSVKDIQFQEAAVKNPVLTYIGNPLMKGYWCVVSRFIS
jgi:hypothetical protein